jgi:hypothetical protein
MSQRNFNQKKGGWRPILGVFGSFLLLLALGCSQNSSSSSGTTTGSGGYSGGSGSGWVVTVTPAQTTLPVSVISSIVTLSTTTVIIAVRDSSGAFPPESSVVSLTCSSGAFGFVGPDYSRPITSKSVTIIRGQAVVDFIAGTVEGLASINALFQGVTGTATITIIPRV